MGDNIISSFLPLFILEDYSPPFLDDVDLYLKFYTIIFISLFSIRVSPKMAFDLSQNTKIKKIKKMKSRIVVCIYQHINLIKESKELRNQLNSD